MEKLVDVLENQVFCLVRKLWNSLKIFIFCYRCLLLLQHFTFGAFKKSPWTSSDLLEIGGKAFHLSMNLSRFLEPWSINTENSNAVRPAEKTTPTIASHKANYDKKVFQSVRRRGFFVLFRWIYYEIPWHWVTLGDVSRIAISEIACFKVLDKDWSHERHSRSGNKIALYGNRFQFPWNLSNAHWCHSWRRTNLLWSNWLIPENHSPATKPVAQQWALPNESSLRTVKFNRNPGAKWKKFLTNTVASLTTARSTTVWS